MIRVSIFLCWLLLVVPAWSHTIVDLGDNFFPNAINSCGEVVGICDGRAAYWSARAGVIYLTEIDSSAKDINDSGQIVGWYTSSDLTRRPFLLSFGKAIELIDADSQGQAAAISNLGMVTGYCNEASSGLFQAFRSTPRRLFQPKDDYRSYANDINVSGWVVGQSQSQAFLWRNTLTLLPIPGGYDLSEAIAINSRGYIVGTVGKEVVPSVINYPVIWTPVRTTFLGNAPGKACAINDRNQIVGQVAGVGVFWSSPTSKYQPVTSLLRTNNGWQPYIVTSINYRGCMVGFGLYQGTTHGFLVKP